MLSWPRRRYTVGIVVLCGIHAIPAAAQPETARRGCRAAIGTLERRDVPPITAAIPDSGRSMLGDVTQCVHAGAGHSRWVRPVLPRLRTVFAGGLPSPMEDGELWAGRGTSLALRAGFVVDASVLHVVVAPEVVTSANKPFDNEPARSPALSSFASPYYGATGNSLDLPERFGASRLTRITTGASAAWISLFGISAGWSASPQQWGPGMRGSLLLGAATAGVPRVFLRSTSPIATRFGAFDGALFLGTLTESQYFDANTSNNYRALSAFGLTWSPNLAGHFTVGAARGVMRPIDDNHPRVTHAFDALSASGKGADDLLSVFARVGAPSDPLSAWVELARSRPGFGLRSFLTLPYDATSYIVGVRGTAALRRGRLEALAEAANLEQGQDVIGRVPRDFYSGFAAPQGWTQRGRTLGHSVGPGGQSQFAAADWVFGTSRIGVFAERTRRNEDALFREYLPYPNRHDVSLEIGVRGALLWRGSEIGIEGSMGKRINYEFQNAEYLPSVRTVDIATPRLRFSFIPQSQR